MGHKYKLIMHQNFGKALMVTMTDLLLITKNLLIYKFSLNANKAKNVLFQNIIYKLYVTPNTSIL